MFANLGSLFCQILSSYSRYGPKLIKILPNWRNLAKSGHTGYSRPHVRVELVDPSEGKLLQRKTRSARIVLPAKTPFLDKMFLNCF